MNKKNDVQQSLNRITIHPDVLYKRLGEEMVLFHLTTDRFYELNGTAARFWELLSEGHPMSEVSEQMMTEFSVTADEFAGQAEDLLRSLRKENLVDVHE